MVFTGRALQPRGAARARCCATGSRWSAGLFVEEEIAPGGADGRRAPRSRAPRWRPSPAGADLLYARVDLCPAHDGAPLVIELELLEPSLFLAHVAGSRRPAGRRDRRAGSPASQADAVARRRAAGGRRRCRRSPRCATMPVAVDVHQHRLAARDVGEGPRHGRRVAPLAGRRRRCGRRARSPARSRSAAPASSSTLPKRSTSDRGRAQAPGPDLGGGQVGRGDGPPGRPARPRSARRRARDASRAAAAGASRSRPWKVAGASAGGGGSTAAVAAPSARAAGPQEPVVRPHQRAAGAQRHGDRAPLGPDAGVDHRQHHRAAAPAAPAAPAATAPARTSPAGRSWARSMRSAPGAARRDHGVERARRARCPAP